MMEKIIEGKRRKMLGLTTSKKKMRKPLDKETEEKMKNVEIDREILFHEEMSKLPKLDRNDALVQTHTGICTHNIYHSNDFKFAYQFTL